jgi:uncharacterized SAM-binding protein YcdF (DUF218 family)
MIYFHKILPLIVSPLFIILGLIILGLIIGSKKTSFMGLIVLVICSLPIFSNRLIAYLEHNYQLKNISEVDTADAIVVLSGMVRTIQTNEVLSYEFGESVDRIFAGIDLFKENKAPSLILTGGKMPWSIGKPEGEYLRDVAIKYGVPRKNILLTENVQNTDQEAKSVKKILTIDAPKVILVTSAFHMPRAQKVFEEVGIRIVPFPVDFRNASSKLTFMHFMPSAKSIWETSFFVKEMIGRTYYNLKY